MSHVKHPDQNLPLNEEATSNLPSKSSQPPIAMAAHASRENDSPQDVATRLLKTYRQVAATAPASAVSVLAGAPFENVKTRMQSKYFTSALAATRFTYHTEGVRGFWVGTWSPLVSLVITRSAQLSIYRYAKYKIDKIIEHTTGESPLQHVNKVGTYPNVSTWVCFGGAGMIAGGLLSTVLAPVELIKNCAQTSVLMASETPRAPGAGKNHGRVSSYNAVRQVVSERGVLGLYTAFRLHLARDIIGSGIYFGVYEAVKQSMNSLYGATDVNAPGAVAFAGAVCGVVAWCVTYPLDSMKTQAQNRLVGVGAKRAASAMMTEAGKAAMNTNLSKWKGIEMVLLRSAVQSMIQMTMFEEIKRWIDGLKFSDGTMKLPHIERQLGRDQKIDKKRSEQ